MMSNCRQKPREVRYNLRVCLQLAPPLSGHLSIEQTSINRTLCLSVPFMNLLGYILFSVQFNLVNGVLEALFYLPSLDYAGSVAVVGECAR